jgi:undecaprenyl-diphosphatase
MAAMSIFQIVVHAIIQGFAGFLPVSASGHAELLSQALGWPEPEAALQGYFLIGLLLAALIYFVHDWASMLSSFLGVLIFRKRPMTPDERMPFFILLSAVPWMLAWTYLRPFLPEEFAEPRWIAVALAACGLPLFLGERLGRKTKGMFDWNLIDSCVVGIGQLLQLVPGGGGLTGGLAAGMLRGYAREATVKFACYAAVPVLVTEVVVAFRSTEEVLPPLTAAIAVSVTFGTGLLAIGSLFKAVRTRSMASYATYRLVAAAALFALAWARASGVLASHS